MTKSRSVIVRWTREGRILVRQKDEPGVTYSTEEFRRGDGLQRGVTVKVGYGQGVTLIGWLADFLKAELIDKVYVYSGHGHRTELAGTTLRTVDVWKAANPLSQVVRAHPVYAALSPFAPCGHPGSFAAVISMIFDPRWYHDPSKPDRLGALEAAFSLEPRYDNTTRNNRGLLAACWCGPTGPGTEAADFYGRTHLAHKELGRTGPQAVRKTGRHFLKALVACWLDSYAMDRGYQGDPMFDPKMLFDKTALQAVGIG